LLLKRHKVSKSFSNKGSKTKFKNNNKPASNNKDIDLNIPLTRHKILKRPRNDSYKAKSKNNNNLTNNNKDYIIYNNPSSNKAKEILLMQELTKEEHKKL
jgi:hypothetical protein